MKSNLRTLSAVVLASLSAAVSVPGCRSIRGGDERYGARIVIVADETDRLKVEGTVLASWLEKMTGARFAVESRPAETGIHLMLADAKALPPGGIGDLKQKGKEAFLIRSPGGGDLWIVGNSPLAVEHGVYFYLDRLGCRWLLPNDHWTIIPHRRSIGLKIDRVEAPAFRLRNFFGTGGFGGRLPVDPNMQLQARWEEWKRRNNLGGDIAVAGHSYEAFNVAHKAELIAHPEYMAEIDGKRQPWGPGTKPCTSNPGLRKLYVDDRLAAFQRVIDKDPDSPQAFAVSVEPSDGGGHCQCAQCRKLGSVSDQAFFLANEVARAVAAKYPGKHVSLFAYNEHAAVPDISLEPNVFVLVVPYGFQRTGLPGDELLGAWAKKCLEPGVYDYWGIPDWANCLPALSYRTTVPAKIRFWHEHSVDAFLGESSFSAGNVGIVWYVASRLLWNADTDVRALLDDFYEKSFGPAAPPMRCMLERWNDGFMLTGQELALSFRDLQEALSLAKDDAVRARIGDFVLYVEYIRRWHAYRGGATDHEAATRALLEYIWRIYDSAMVQTFRMHQLIVSRYEKGAQEWAEAWPLKNPKAESWTSLQPVTSEEIARFIADGLQSFKPVEYDARTYSGKLVPLLPSAKTGGEWLSSPVLAGEQWCAFWAGKDVTNVEFQIRCGPRRAAFESPFDRVTILDPNGKTILHESVEPDGGWHPIAVPTPGAGLYRMSVFDQKLTFALKTPANVPFVLTGGFACPTVSTRTYFYVPKGLKRIALYAEDSIPVELCDGDGRPVGGKTGGLIVRDVPPGQDGRVWSFTGYKSWMTVRPINFPAAFAFSPAGLLVPEDALTNPTHPGN